MKVWSENYFDSLTEKFLHWIMYYSSGDDIFFFVKWLPEKIIEHIFRYWTTDFKAKVIELSFYVMLEFYMIL